MPQQIFFGAPLTRTEWQLFNADISMNRLHMTKNLEKEYWWVCVTHHKTSARKLSGEGAGMWHMEGGGLQYLVRLANLISRLSMYPTCKYFDA